MPPAPPRAVRGFIVGSWVGGVHPDGPPAPVVTEFMSVFKALPADFGAEILHLGPALKQYEMGAREGPGGIIRPPITYAVKFASKAKAAAFFDYPPYVAFKDKYKIGRSVLRLLRRRSERLLRRRTWPSAARLILLLRRRSTGHAHY